DGIKVGVVNARFIKPMDEDMLLSLTRRYDLFITVEDNVVAGGFGSGVLEFFARKGLSPKVVNLGIPDTFIEHGNQNLLRNKVGIDAEGIERTVRDALMKRPIKL
ncbi:MAG TPA: 1-deoxy-D-xylulose-5-phosphate synthase, partial [Aquificaceae bacterium]|nr:1-deoxy-D-xylulose-5-phosphate synthase [Aquificaceae bacterium]